MASITLVPVGTPPQTPYTVQDNLDQLQTDLGSSDPGQGASLVGVEPNGCFTSTNLQDALEEICAGGGGSGTIAGTIAANEVAFGTDVDTIGGSSSLIYDAGTQTLSVLDAGATDSVNISVATGDVVNITSTVPVRFGGETQTLQKFVAFNGLGSQSEYGSHDIALADYSGTPTTPTIGGFPGLNLTAGEIQINGATGSAGQVLTSNGAGAAPTWQNLSGDVWTQTGTVLSPTTPGDTVEVPGTFKVIVTK